MGWVLRLRWRLRIRRSLRRSWRLRGKRREDSKQPQRYRNSLELMQEEKKLTLRRGSIC